MYLFIFQMNSTEIGGLLKDRWQESGIYVCLFLIVIIIVVLIAYCRARKKNKVSAVQNL